MAYLEIPITGGSAATSNTNKFVIDKSDIVLIHQGDSWSSSDKSNNKISNHHARWC
jgi:hypothetical protein